MFIQIKDILAHVAYHLGTVAHGAVWSSSADLALETSKVYLQEGKRGLDSDRNCASTCWWMFPEEQSKQRLFSRNYAIYRQESQL